jgi:hypothetical protein
MCTGMVSDTKYDLAGGVSPTDLARLMKHLAALQEQLKTWLQKVHSELPKGVSK